MKILKLPNFSFMPCVQWVVVGNGKSNNIKETAETLKTIDCKQP